MSDSFNFKDLNINYEALESLRSNLPSLNTMLPNPEMDSKYIERFSNEIANRRREQEEREIRNLEINEERLQYDKLKLFLLSSVNREQKNMLEKIDSLIDTIEFGGKVAEGNLTIIERELISLRESTNNLNESFIQFIQKKMIEQGVEEAIKYFFIGIKTLFLSNN